MWTQLLQVGVNDTSDSAKTGDADNGDKSDTSDNDAGDSSVSGNTGEYTSESGDSDKSGEVEEDLLLRLVQSLDRVSSSGYRAKGLALAAAGLVRNALLASNSAKVCDMFLCGGCYM